MSNYIFTLDDGGFVPVIIESRRGSHNITLRPKTAPEFEIHISKPFFVPETQALKFLESKRKWVQNIFNRTPKKCVVCDGDEIEFLGRCVRLVRTPGARSNNLEQGADGKWIMYVGGAPEMFERRVRDTIKAELLKSIKEIIRETPREFWPTRIALRDTTTRWGSRSSTGTISFSWRLAFAPVSVMRYVVMHELAHTKHMDHSPAFWRQVAELYGFGVERAKRWLTQNGAGLHRYL